MIRALFMAVFAVTASVLSWVLPTAWLDDWPMAQRVITNLLMPIGLLWLMMLGAAIYQMMRGRRLLGTALLGVYLVIWVSFCPLVADALMGQVEMPLWEQSPVAADAPHYRAIVVLGGAGVRNRQGYTQVSEGGERMVMAAKLWHAGKTPWVICTGTALANDGPIADYVTAGGIVRSDRFAAHDPAQIGLEMMAELGVPAERIIRCGGQHTTAEMVNLHELFSNWQPTEDPVGESATLPIGLITNAFHLPRANRLAGGQRFDELGVTLLPIPAGSEIRDRSHMAFAALVPTAEAGFTITRGCKELLAKLAGR